MQWPLPNRIVTESAVQHRAQHDAKAGRMNYVLVAAVIDDAEHWLIQWERDIQVKS